MLHLHLQLVCCLFVYGLVKQTHDLAPVYTSTVMGPCAHRSKVTAQKSSASVQQNEKKNIKSRQDMELIVPLKTNLHSSQYHDTTC